MRPELDDALPKDRPSRVIVFSVAPLWTPHFATELELACVHRDRGDQVHVLHCRGGIDSCMPNPSHRLERCILCRSQSDTGFEAAGIDPSRIEELRPSRHVDVSDLPTPETIEDLRRWTWDGADLGEAVLSSLISVLRDPAPDLSEHRGLLSAMLSASLGLYIETTRALERLRPDLVYVFNGRTATTRPLIRAASKLGVPFVCHDMGYELGTYRLVPGGMVHDLKFAKQAIERTWENSDLPLEERKRIGARFFEGRRFGGEGDAPPRYQFSAAQEQGRLPSTFQNDARNVAIFNSSEDEFAAIAEYRNPVYEDQMTALEAIVSEPRLRDVSFYIRVHPNLAGINNEQTRRLEELRGSGNLTLISATEPVDTYALMEEVDAVVTFGSTTGVEALYAGTPSILIGRALYEDLGCIRPNGHNDIVTAILGPLPPVDRNLPLQFGFYLRRGGVTFKRFEHRTYLTGKFEDMELAPGDRARTLATWVKRFRLAAEDPSRVWSALRRRIGSKPEARHE